MFNIDFGSLPSITKKLAPTEISQLNGLFQDPSIQNRLEEIETQRKIRQKWKWVVYGGSTAIALSLSFLFGTGESLIGKLLNGFFFTIGEGDDSFSPVIWATIISYSVGIGSLYTKFASKIEIPLKSEVLSKICPLLYSKLEYSYDEKYSFDELEYLKGKNFLSSYDQIDSVEDSIHFTMEKDGKDFSLNGFEVETSEIRGSGKHRQRVTTNHAYLMKVIFPHARIPLTSDLYIKKDVADQSGGMKIIGPILSGIIAFLITIVLFPKEIIIAFIIAGFVVWGTHYLIKKSQNKNRIQLENIDFEKLFDVKCDDQVTSRMILTPAFMDRIVTFVNKTGNQYEFLFQNNIMYIKRQIFGKYLEAGTEKNMLTNLSGFADFYSDMREIMMFASDMNLTYLSNTDTSSKIEDPNILTLKPISFQKMKEKQAGFFSKFVPGFSLKV